MNTIENSYIVNREVGELGLSIATDLAISRALGKHPLITDKSPPINDYNMLAINLRTLVRNFYGAIEHAIRKQINPNSPVSKIIDEISVIRELIGSSKVAIYYCTYDALQRTYPNASVRKLTTENQIKLAMQEQTTALKVMASLKERNIDVTEFNVKLSGTEGMPKALIMTHQPVDLLSSTAFAKLDLLESHTGAIKPKLLWYTKLSKYKSEHLDMMPFNSFTIQLFGDNGNLLDGKDPKLKETVVELAKKYNWTPATTMDRVRLGISNIPNASYRDEIKKLL